MVSAYISDNCENCEKFVNVSKKNSVSESISKQILFGFNVKLKKKTRKKNYCHKRCNRKKKSKETE